MLPNMDPANMDHAAQHGLPNMDPGFGERVETFFSPSMGHHAGRPTTDL